MAFSFKVGPSVLGLIWSGTGSGAGTVAGARTQRRSVSGAGDGDGAAAGSGFRAGAGAGADAAPGAGAGLWAGESATGDDTDFADVTLKSLSVFNRVCTDLRITEGTLFHSAGTHSRLQIRSTCDYLSSFCSV